MKPLKLVIEGINSFVQAREIDFERLGADGIFCVCGPTGSGKTTILDGIILALYGENKNRGNLADYINTKCDKGKITLEFELEGERYSAYRELRRKTGTAAARLTKIKTGEIVADRSDTVNACVKEMLKLDKDEFTKVVVLEQGKFARFMQMTGKDRSKTVAKLFSLERFEKLKETLATAKNKYDKLADAAEAALKQYEDATEEKFADKQREIKRLKKETEQKQKGVELAENELKTMEQLKAAADKRAKAEFAVAQARAELGKIAEQKRELCAERESLDTLKRELAELKIAADRAQGMIAKIAECVADEEAKKKKEQERGELLKAYKDTDGKIKEITERTKSQNETKDKNSSKAASIMRDVSLLGYSGKEVSEAAFSAIAATALADYKTLKDAESKRAQAQKELEKFTLLAEKYIKGEYESKQKTESLKAEAERAKNEYETARINFQAESVRASLHDGDICPVCGGEYRGACNTDSGNAAELAALKEKSESAAKRYEKAADEYKDILREQQINGENRARAEKDCAEQGEILSGKSSENARRAAELAKEGAESAKAAADAERAISDYAAPLATARANLEKIEADGKRLRAEIDGLNEKIAERLGGANIAAAQASANKAIQDHKAAQEKADKLTEELNKKSEDITGRESSAKAVEEENKKTLAQLPASDFNAELYGEKLSALSELKEIVAVLQKDAGGMEAEAKSLRERLNKKKELAAEKREISKTLERVLELNACVKGDNKLLSFVAEEYVQSFTAAASETLSRLTGGKYTLIYEGGEFWVEDFFADNARRKVKTLSGGETFLASVSIAMAISREIAADRRYEFFFLDEGFGTLDERAIETVTEALVSLSRDTTVGIITHRAELAERIGARLSVIPATEDEGSRVEFTGV